MQIITSQKLLVFLFSLCFVFAISCSSDDDSGPAMMEEEEEEMDPCDGVTSTFAANVKPLIDASCAISGCHVSGGNGSGNFEEFDGIKNRANNIITRVITIGDMPPSNSAGPSLDTDQRNLIRCWIEDGAQNN